jgi:pyruvate dehydrogenase E1 component beta subunit
LANQEVDIREALRQAIDEEIARDSTVFILGEEVAEYDGAYKVTKGLWKKWGDKRVIDTPISESGFSGLAIGAAISGLRPIVEFMSFNFSFVAFDQIVSRACKLHYMSGGRLKVPIVFRGPNGAAARVSCQHSHNVESLYAHFPGLKVVAPSNAYDAKGLLKSAIRDDNPVLFLENELMYGLKQEIPKEEYLVPIGLGNILSSGKHVTLISHSRMLLFCMEAKDFMRKKGIEVEVIDLRSIKPIDAGLIASSVRKTGRAVIVEEGHKFAGVAAEVTAIIMEHCFDFLDAPVKRVCQLETPLPYAPPLEEWTIPNTKRIIKAIEEVIEGL